MPDKFETNARTVALLTFLSRITGLLRDAALSRVFGAGALMDAFFFAFMIPNLFRRLFGEGALAAAFLPTYAQLDRDDPATARRLASLLVALLVTVLGGLVLVAEAVMYLIPVLDRPSPVLWLTMIMLPYMPMVCLVAILGSMLQVRGRFGPTAASPVVLNLCMIAGAVGTLALLRPQTDDDRLRHLSWVAGTVLAAGVLQVLWSLLALRGSGTLASPARMHSAPARRRAWAAARQPLRRVFTQAGPMVVGLSVLQLNTFIDGLVASYPVTVGPTIFGVPFPLAEGAMAAITFAQHLYQFPLGVFGIAVATAIFPLLARQAHDGAAFDETIRRGLRLVVFIGLPASAGLMLVCEPLAAVTLQGGQFTLDQTRQVAFVLLGYAPAIWAYSMVHVLTRAFYARGDAKTPVRIAMSLVGLNLVLNCTLIWTPLKEAGLAWSTATCSMIQAAVLLGALRRRIGFTIGSDVLASWLRTFILTALMVLGVGLLSLAFPEAPSAWSVRLVELLSLVGAGGLIVVAAAAFMRMPELPWALGRTANSRQQTANSR